MIDIKPVSQIRAPQVTARRTPPPPIPVLPDSWWETVAGAGADAAASAGRKPWKVWAAALSVLLVVASAGVGIYRTQRDLTVALASRQSVEVNGPLKVDFSQDVASGFAVTIEPKVAGSWEQHRTVLGVSAVSFVPEKRFEPGRKYALTITGLKRSVTGAGLADFKSDFTAQLPSAVKSTSPATGAKDVPTKPKLSVTLREANRGVRSLKPSLSPAVELKPVSSDDKTFVWEPVTALKQGENYTFSLEDMRMPPETRKLFATAFTTVGQPAIASAREGGLFAPGQTVDIVFGQPMEKDEKAFKFGLDGKGGWTDDHTYRFTPAEAALKPGTSYSYTVKAGLKSKAGGVLEADRNYAFATNGEVNAAFSPGGGDVAQNAKINVAFDQAVDHASAQSKFSLSPGANGSFSWSGNTMTYSPGKMNYQTKYTAQVAAGVKPVWGLENTKVLAGSFTTVAETIKLGVPVYKTGYKMSCELDGLRMLLAFRGVNVSEWDILMRVGYNPRPRDKATNTWDDPNVMYVGDVNGNANYTSYGVHAGPIAAAARSFGRSATSANNVSAQYIAARIHEGNPVLFWGHSTPAKPDSWNTPGGGVVQTWLSSHARVVYGVVGSADHPIGFHIIETSRGTTMYWTTAQLMANMNIMPGVSNQVVVAY